MTLFAVRGVLLPSCVLSLSTSVGVTSPAVSLQMVRQMEGARAFCNRSWSKAAGP